MVILIHSSKAMRAVVAGDNEFRQPRLLGRAQQLDTCLKTLSTAQLAKVMKLSIPLAKTTHALIAEWTAAPQRQAAAIDTFIGDIYSGLQAPTLSATDRAYADKTLYILSGLYGILRPLDGICPYRLEMGYKLPNPAYANLYRFWGDAIAACLPVKGPIVNLAAVEYSDAVTSYVAAERVVAPRFLTVSPKTGEPTFVVVHAKIARGAFARWLIVNRIRDPKQLIEFAEIGYRYSKKLSKPGSPAFVAKEFGGTGLSIR